MVKVNQSKTVFGSNKDRDFHPKKDRMTSFTELLHRCSLRDRTLAILEFKRSLAETDAIESKNKTLTANLEASHRHIAALERELLKHPFINRKFIKNNRIGHDK